MTDNQTEKQKVQELTDKDVELTMMDAQKGIDEYYGYFYTTCPD